MLLAILYDASGRITAAAPACDQQPFGDRYWRDIYPERVSLRGSETAYLNIEDPQLLDRLLRMDFSDNIEATEVVDEYLGLATHGGLDRPD